LHKERCCVFTFSNKSDRIRKQNMIMVKCERIFPFSKRCSWNFSKKKSNNNNKRDLIIAENWRVTIEFRKFFSTMYLLKFFCIIHLKDVRKKAQIQSIEIFSLKQKIFVPQIYLESRTWQPSGWHLTNVNDCCEVKNKVNTCSGYWAIFTINTRNIFF
jgi:hypothetical protein